MTVTCPLCFHHCQLAPGQTGVCHARVNRGGEICSLNYGKITALALDPIEKKPLRRFHPGSHILSVGSFGCNLHCPFCQNHEIAQPDQAPPVQEYTPEQLVQLALAEKARGNIGIAYTYNEPLVGYEFVLDTARIARKAGLYNVLVSNGTVEEQPFSRLLSLLDALNLDLKGFTPQWYRTLGGDLDTVKRSIQQAAACCHLEVTTLVIPGCNDSPQEMDALSRWLAQVDPGIPLHVSRFFPRHRMSSLSPTPVEQVYALAEVARAHLDHVYTGNC